MAPRFVSLGMVVLDELRFPKSPTMYDVAGGSGAYSTVSKMVSMLCGGLCNSIQHVMQVLMP